ncbi:MAG: aspartyl-tRNA(Asn)/glutamyl-tRNA(Gln) amidotransferase subunit [Ilumatobacteraceae bacterium]
MSDELHWLSIGELSDRLHARDVSSVEVTEATLQRIEATEGTVHAYAGVMADSALADARRADDEFARGESRGPLHGVPVGVKDLLHTAGFPTEGGSRVLAGFVPESDAVVVTKLREAGAVIVGKTVTHEFAYGQDVPPTRNAWNHACYPGGSSAGSGVAVAVGSAYGAIGTDTGGSIRAPASVNGVVGLKPTHGRVSRRGVMPMSPTLDTTGPLTRTVRDNALMLAAIAGGGSDDRTVIQEPVPDYAAGLTSDLRGVRVGVERGYFFYDAVSDDVREAVDAAIARLGELGATIVPVEIDRLELSVPAGMAVLVGDTSEWHQKLLRERGSLYVRETRVMLELGEIIFATAYAKAQKVRRLLQDSVREAFVSNDLHALAAPTLPVTTMPVEQLSVDLTGSGESAVSAFIHHCFIANLIGIPSLSIPVGFDPAELPIGMQLFGRPFGEADLFQIGHAYQGATSWHERHPELVAVA